MMLSPFLKQRLTAFISSGDHSFIERLAVYIESGAVTPSVQATFPLADAPRAIDQLDTGQATGKIVIIVRDNGDDRVPRHPSAS
jgi:NADPH:quinone reductase-like Zn-dependent oxidoreductase